MGGENDRGGNGQRLRDLSRQIGDREVVERLKDGQIGVGGTSETGLYRLGVEFSLSSVSTCPTVRAVSLSSADPTATVGAAHPSQVLKWSVGLGRRVFGAVPGRGTWENHGE